MGYVIKPIKNDKDYEDALAAVSSLINEDPMLGTENADKLEVLATLIEKYEDTYYRIEPPYYIDAIKFRMEQQNLQIADLIPYIGTASRVSEILSGKKKLTVEMVNSLANGLNIPEKSLLNQEKGSNEYSRNIPTAIFNKMIKRGYFDNIDSHERATTLQLFFERHSPVPAAFYRKSSYRIGKNSNLYLLVAWANRIIDKAANISIPDYKDGTVSLEYMRKIARYSVDDECGVLNALKQLADDGIKVIIEPQLDGMKLDGVCIMEDKKHPVIGMTLRYDRLDNFWFTLMHELAHIALHIETDQDFIYDDMTCQEEQLNSIEKEADLFASNALVDDSVWAYSSARVNPIYITVQSLANEIGVHPVIIAGKARYETGKWSCLPNLIKTYKVRKYFKEVTW